MDDLLQEIKLELEIDFTDLRSDDLLLSLITRAYRKIIKYLNKEFSFDHVISHYPDAVLEITCSLYRNRNRKNSNKEGIKQKTQGSRSVTYSDIGDVMTDEIKDMLPLPFVGVM